MILWTILFTDRNIFTREGPNGEVVRYQSARVAAQNRMIATTIIGTRLGINALDESVVCASAGMANLPMGMISLKHEDGYIEACEP